MKKIIVAACVAATFLLSGNALATLYTLTDSVSFGDTSLFNDSESINGVDTVGALSTDLNSFGGGDANDLSYSGDWVYWTHNYTFEPVYDELLSAELSLNLEDDGVDCWFKWEIGLTLSEDGIIDIAEVDTGTYNYDLDLTNIGDGSYQVALVDLAGDFIINSSTLTIKYSANNTPAPVPEPGTMVLFRAAMGVTGLVSLRRKYFKTGK